MKRTLHCAFLLGTLAAAGCAQFESGSSSPIGPSSVTPVSTGGSSGGGSSSASLLGTWSSITGQSLSGSSCSNLQWTVTSQTATSIGVDFSFECVGGIHATGSGTGQLNGSDVPYQITGSGTLPGVASCPFSLSGTARIDNSDTLRIPYSGTTCLGPIRGEETLHRPAPQAPAPAPAPEPDPAPAPAPEPPPVNSFHVGAGPTSVARAEQVVNATAAEFPSLIAPKGSDGEAQAAATELLRRMIWHLQLAGYQSGRQKNPSGAVSGDKLTVFADGAWHAFDVFYDYGVANQATKVIFFEVTPPNPLGDGGIPD